MGFVENCTNCDAVGSKTIVTVVPPFLFVGRRISGATVGTGGTSAPPYLLQIGQAFILGFKHGAMIQT